MKKTAAFDFGTPSRENYEFHCDETKKDENLMSPKMTKQTQTRSISFRHQKRTERLQSEKLMCSKTKRWDNHCKPSRNEAFIDLPRVPHLILLAQREISYGHALKVGVWKSTVHIAEAGWGLSKSCTSSYGSRMETRKVEGIVFFYPVELSL